jgi:hypothetical protein
VHVAHFLLVALSLLPLIPTHIYLVFVVLNFLLTRGPSLFVKANTSLDRQP